MHVMLLGLSELEYTWITEDSLFGLLVYWCLCEARPFTSIIMALVGALNSQRHHHCKKRGPPAIKKLVGCRHADISPSLFLMVVNCNRCVIMPLWYYLIIDGLASRDLQPPWWLGPVGSSQDLMQGSPNTGTGSEGWLSVFGIMLHFCGMRLQSCHKIHIFLGFFL